MENLNSLLQNPLKKLANPNPNSGISNNNNHVKPDSTKIIEDSISPNKSSQLKQESEKKIPLPTNKHNQAIANVSKEIVAAVKKSNLHKLNTEKLIKHIKYNSNSNGVNTINVSSNNPNISVTSNTNNVSNINPKTESKPKMTNIKIEKKLIIR